MEQQIPPPPPEDDEGEVADLPAGWTEHATASGQAYFYNAASETSTYERPTKGSQNVTVDHANHDGPAEASTAGTVALTTTINGAGKKEKRKRKEKPVQKVQIRGTQWLRVTTSEGNTFYTNTETKTSVWTIPDEIKEQVAMLDRYGPEGQAAALAAAAAKQEAEAAAKALQEKEAEMERLRTELLEEREASRKRKLQEEVEEHDHGDVDASAKRVRVKDDSDDASDNVQQLEEEQASQLEDWQLDELQAKADMDAELAEPPVVGKHTDLSSEESVAIFKAMLAEKDINPMRPWDMELPKFIGDSRYKAVKTLRERRDLFDDHCKHIVRERRAQKAAGGAKKSDPATAYRALLVAEVRSTRTRWDDFRKDHKKDARFRDYGRDDREREKAFRNWLRELGEIKRADAEKAESQFMEMLKENKPDTAGQWSEIKSRFSKDPRYSGVASSSLKQELFNQYVASYSPVSAKGPGETDEAKAAARKVRQEASLREREAAVRKEKTALEQLTEKGKAAATRADDERDFRTLLIDAVRDPHARWTDSLSTLERDSRYQRSQLKVGEQRRMFDDHIDQLQTKRIDALENLFVEHAQALDTPFEKVYNIISANPVVTRLDMSRDRLARRYEDWSDRRSAQARKDLEALLSESAFVEYWGRLKQEVASKQDAKAKEALAAETEPDEDAIDDVDLRQMAAQIDLKEIQAVLKHDKRYTNFDYDPELRKRWIRMYLEKLSKPKQTVFQR